MRSLTSPSVVMALALDAGAVDVLDGSRCHCPCHGRKAPLLTDHTEGGMCCDQCVYLHYEAAALERSKGQ